MRPGQLRALEAQPPQRFHQHVSKGGQQQPELVGPPRVTAGAVTEEVELLFLDSVFGFPPRAVSLLIEGLGRPGPVSDHVARVGPISGVFGFDDHPSRPIPAARLIIKLPKEAHLLLAGLMLGLAVGFWQNLDELRANWQVDRTWEPGWSDEQRAVGRARWKKAVERTREWEEK